VLVAKKSWWPLLGVAVLTGSLPAAALDFPLEITCPAWPAESKGQVEARIRVTVLAEALDARRVQVSCAESAVSIFVESSTGNLARPVDRRSARVEDDVVAAVEAALRDLARSPEPEPPLRPPVPPTTPTPAASAPVTPPAQTLRVIAPARAASTLSEVSLAPTLERFKGRWAVGGSVGLDVGTESFQYGLGLGGRTVSGLPAAFNATEWNAAVRLAWTPALAAGVRGTVGVGASVLIASPAANVVSRTSTVLSAGFLQLQLSRPFWLGRFGVAPGVGLRLFTARRNVRVNQQEQLVVTQLAPDVTLSFVYQR
jgi:hypothetical protein